MTYGRRTERTEYSFAYYATKHHREEKGWFGRLNSRVAQIRHALKYINDAEADNLAPLRTYLTIKSTELTKGATRQEIVDTYENIVVALLQELNRRDHEEYDTNQEYLKLNRSHTDQGHNLQRRTEQAAQGAQRVIFREAQILSLIDLIHPQESIDGTPYVDLDTFYRETQA